MSINSRNPCMLDLNKIHLVAATLQEYPIIQNLGRFYAYDMSLFLGFEEGWEMPDDGLYTCMDLKKYWQTNDAYPFLVYYQNELVGFVIIDKVGSDDSIEFNVAQFFIVNKFKNKGVGRKVATLCFDKFPGKWEIRVIPGNDGAYHFWRSVIRTYTNDKFDEYFRDISRNNIGKRNLFSFTV